MAIVTKTIHNGARRMLVQISKTDGSVEINTVAVDKSTLTGPNGLEPGHLGVERIEWSISTIGDVSPVKIVWDLTADELIAALSGQGFLCYLDGGNNRPSSGGGTGDVTISNAAVASGGYTILLWIIKND